MTPELRLSAIGRFLRKPGASATAIHQFLPGLAPGDAISDEAFEIQRTIRSLGRRSEVFVWPAYLHGSLRKVAFPVDLYRPSDQDVLIYHLSIGSPLSDVIRELPGRKMMIYHNVTPDHFALPYNRKVAEELRGGRIDLAKLRSAFRLALGDSEYNCRELEKVGYPRTGVLPILLNLGRYEVPPDRPVQRFYRDGKVNILSVGRVIPNKCPHDLVKAFAIYQKFINPRSRLLIVGSYGGFDGYYRQIQGMARELALRDVVVTGHVTLPELIAYYRVADVLVSVSEHEGFCVPMVESFLFGLPVVAYKAAAVPGTVGDAGVLFDSKDPHEIAEIIDCVCSTPKLRADLVCRGQRRFECLFHPQVVKASLTVYLQQMLESAPPSSGRA